MLVFDSARVMTILGLAYTVLIAQARQGNLLEILFGSATTAIRSYCSRKL